MDFFEWLVSQSREAVKRNAINIKENLITSGNCVHHFRLYSNFSFVYFEL